MALNVEPSCDCNLPSNYFVLSVVVDFRLEQLLIRHGDEDVVQGFHLGVDQIDGDDIGELAVEEDAVAHLEGAAGHHDQAGDGVSQGVDGGKPDDGPAEER